MLSRLESGKRRLALEHIAGLAGTLGVSADDLLGGAPPVDPRVRHQPATYDNFTVWPLTNWSRSGGLNLVRVRMGGWTEFFVALYPVHQEQHKRRPLYD